MAKNAQSKIAESKIAELKKEHGDELYLATCLGEQFVFKIDSAAWDRCADYASDKDKRSAAMSTLFHDTVVCPVGPELEAIVRRKPALPTSVGNFIAEAHGMTENGEVKKL